MNSNHQLDLVVVGFTGEMRALKLQARSIRLFAEKGMFGRIFYICNDPCFGPFKRYIHKHVKPELGAFGEYIEVVPYKHLTGKRLKKTGWRSQQALKLLAANIVSASQYLILDSKNHFIRPIDTRTFIAEDGQLRVHSLPINPLFRQHFNNACQYFGVIGGEDVKSAHPTTTPFLMKTEIAQALMTDVEMREGKSFFDVFINNTKLNEFYFYYAYMLSNKQMVQSYYSERSRYSVGLFSGSAKSSERVQMLLKTLENEDICCTGVHRRIYEVSLPENLKLITGMWLRYGLIENEAEAAYFQIFEKRLKHKRFILF